MSTLTITACRCCPPPAGVVGGRLSGCHPAFVLGLRAVFGYLPTGHKLQVHRCSVCSGRVCVAARHSVRPSWVEQPPIPVATVALWSLSSWSPLRSDETARRCALFGSRVSVRHGLNYIGKPTFSQHYFLLVDICYRNSDNCVMTPNDLKKHFGTKAKIARATGASWASVQDWFNNGEVPEGRQYQIELATKGQLRASRPANRSECA